MLYDVHDPDDAGHGGDETWRDIAAQYRSEHQGEESLLTVVDELLLDLGDALAVRAARESHAGQPALARRTRRFERRVHELFRLTETAAQAQMASAALDLGAPEWLFEGEEGAAWRREITALADYVGWACGGETPGAGTPCAVRQAGGA